MFASDFLQNGPLVTRIDSGLLSLILNEQRGHDIRNNQRSYLDELFERLIESV